MQTESAERSGLLDSKQMMELSARGRDVMALLQTMPGVVDDANGGDTLGQFSTPTMQGMRQNYNALNIDGISGNTARGRTAESPVNMDAIAEVRVLTNSYTAEYGTASGGVINIVTQRRVAELPRRRLLLQPQRGFQRQRLLQQPAGRGPASATASTPRAATSAGRSTGPATSIPTSRSCSSSSPWRTCPISGPNSVSNFTMPTELERKGDFSKSFRNATTLYPAEGPDHRRGVPRQRDSGQPHGSELGQAAHGLPAAERLPIPRSRSSRTTTRSPDTRNCRCKNETLRRRLQQSEKARFWFKGVGFSSDNTGRTSPAIQNQWGLADVDYSQTMPQVGAKFTYIVSPTLVNQATFGVNLWTEQQKLDDEGLKAYQRATYGINIKQGYPDDNPLGLIPAMSLRRHHRGGIGQLRWPLPDGGRLDDVQLQRQPHQGLAQPRIQARLPDAARAVQPISPGGRQQLPGFLRFRQTDANNPNDSGYAYANALLGNYNTYTEATNRVDYAPDHEDRGMVRAGPLEADPPPHDGRRDCASLGPVPQDAGQRQCRKLRALPVQSLEGARCSTSRP